MLHAYLWETTALMHSAEKEALAHPRLVSALTCLEQSVKLDADNELFLARYVQLLEHSGRKKDAERVLLNQCEADRTNPAKQRMLYLHLKRCQPDLALPRLKILSMLATSDPYSPELLDALLLMQAAKAAEVESDGADRPVSSSDPEVLALHALCATVEVGIHSQQHIFWESLAHCLASVATKSVPVRLVRKFQFFSPPPSVKEEKKKHCQPDARNGTST
eukprot:m.184193 g.184193  ORF g.184193 m.184193 type:complete len:220 (+) comp21542_c0_seq1:105-764(+)